MDLDAKIVGGKILAKEKLMRPYDLIATLSDIKDTSLRDPPTHGLINNLAQ